MNFVHLHSISSYFLVMSSSIGFDFDLLPWCLSFLIITYDVPMRSYKLIIYLNNQGFDWIPHILVYYLNLHSKIWYNWSNELLKYILDILVITLKTLTRFIEMLACLSIPLYHIQYSVTPRGSSLFLGCIIHISSSI